MLSINRWIDLKVEQIKFERDIQEEQEENLTDKIQFERDIVYMDEMMKSIEYTNQVKTFLLDLIADVVALEFHEFKDTHNIGKVSEETLRRLVENVAKKIRSAIEYSNFDFNYTVLTDGYLDEFIINTTMLMIKDLFKKSVDEYEGES